MQKRIVVVSLLLHCVLFVSAQMPDWAKKRMEGQVGTWRADNAVYMSEEEPMEAYEIEWRWGIGQQSVVGAMYGIKEGQRTGPMWEFRQYWNPATKAVTVMQFGADGTVGGGELQSAGPDSTMLEQVFHAPEGASFRFGHRGRHTPDADYAYSFMVSEDGEWRPRRQYVWKRLKD